MIGFRSIAIPVLAVGLCASIPAFARAEPNRADRDQRAPQARVDSRRDDGERHDDRAARDVHDLRDGHPEHLDRVPERAHENDREHDRDDARAWRGHWDRDRHDDFYRTPVRIEVAPPVYVQPDVERYVSLYDLPGCVLDAANHFRTGAIESVQYVCRDGKEFYRFIVDGRGHDLDMRISLDGRLLSIEAC